jgi:hypothetical protein
MNGAQPLSCFYLYCRARVPPDQLEAHVRHHGADHRVIAWARGRVELRRRQRGIFRGRQDRARARGEAGAT